MKTISLNNDRDYLIDNLKFILITLVVIGHVYGSYMVENDLLRTITTIIYVFHMPFFVFISGYFSKSVKANYYQKLTVSLLVPYILFVILWDFKEFVHFKTFHCSLLNPPYHLWYLLSLLIWRLVFPLFQNFKYFLIWSILISLVVGLSNTIGNSSLLSRTFGMFPFFVLGTLCSRETLYRIHDNKYLFCLGLIALIVVYIGIEKFHIINFNTLLWDRSYIMNGLTNLKGSMYRLLIMAGAIFMSILLIYITPSKRMFFTAAGSRTFPVYIFHGFIVPSLLSLYPSFNKGWFQDCVILIFPYFLVGILSYSVVYELYSKIMDFINKQLLII